MRISAAGISRFGCVIVILALAGYPVVAQDTTGKIVGIVSDPSGGVVAGATVTVTNAGTQVARQTSTDRQGYYQVLELPIGRYEVAAEAAGFSRMVVTAKNSLEINQTLRIDVTLEVGAVKDVDHRRRRRQRRGDRELDHRRHGQRQRDLGIAAERAQHARSARHATRRHAERTPTRRGRPDLIASAADAPTR